EVGEVRDARAQPVLAARSNVTGALVALQRAELEGERDLLLVGDRLIAKHEHGVPIHPRLDREHVLPIERLRNVDPRDQAGESPVHGANARGHLILPWPTRWGGPAPRRRRRHGAASAVAGRALTGRGRAAGAAMTSAPADDGSCPPRGVSR